jgi:hypothetical protein
MRLTSWYGGAARAWSLLRIDAQTFHCPVWLANPESSVN